MAAAIVLLRVLTSDSGAFYDFNYTGPRWPFCHRDARRHRESRSLNVLRLSLNQSVAASLRASPRALLSKGLIFAVSCLLSS